MKKISKLSLSIGFLATSFTPLLASSCLINVDKETKNVIDYAKNFPIRLKSNFQTNIEELNNDPAIREAANKKTIENVKLEIQNEELKKLNKDLNNLTPEEKQQLDQTVENKFASYDRNELNSRTNEAIKNVSNLVQEAQKALSDLFINKSIYFIYNQNYANIRWISNFIDTYSDKLANFVDYKDILAVINHFFKNTPLNYVFLTKYKSIIKFEAISNKVSFSSPTLLYKTYDQFYTYFFTKFNEIFAQNNTNSYSEGLSEMLKYAIENGLKINNNQAVNGMQAAMPSIFLALRKNLTFTDETESNALFREALEINSDKWYEFIKDPKKFFENADNNNRYSNLTATENNNSLQLAAKNRLIRTLKSIKNEWIDNYGAQAPDVARMFAFIMYFNRVSEVQVSVAYSRINHKLVSYIEFKDKDGKYKYLDVEKAVNDYKAANDKNNFKFTFYDQNIFTNDWTFKPTIVLNSETIDSSNSKYEEAIKNNAAKVLFNDQIILPYDYQSMNTNELVELLNLFAKNSNIEGEK
ncbi:putative lipoprotein Mm14 [Mycoplasmopsis meleagridis]|uniref:Putative lipoprotein Mm14 n=1 Tax=Mycoplasmopsis meleagridis ATCC 25294 TaxID=1264554 RepID=A0A0F5H261_9BACT|nr:hypothetical protein [Mycoplasmopsis meleagridis]KKB26927.1 putative lipoprotein Mm14 [Mycoplasmopsis meleagridis ATCC 25294]OAD18516.1 putative lipoprotein Mm14 [Mycoplasmopsis meleagridis]VEU77615.1 Uncharacterised protein [Mycoplasmopsis meleagridis]